MVHARTNLMHCNKNEYGKLKNIFEIIKTYVQVALVPGATMPLLQCVLLPLSLA